MFADGDAARLVMTDGTCILWHAECFVIADEHTKQDDECRLKQSGAYRKSDITTPLSHGVARWPSLIDRQVS